MANETLGAGFSIDITDLKAGLAQANRLIRESESEFRAAAAGMDDWGESQEGLEKRIKSLNDITGIQQKKVDALQQEYDRLIENGIDPLSKEAVELRTKINKETEALEKNKSTAKKTQKALDDLGEETEDVKDETEEATEGFTLMDGVLSNVIANGITAFIGACVDVVSSLMDISAETEEYRQSMKRLETAFETAGKSAESAKETYKTLYSVLGDEGTANEAASHLAALADSEEDLTKWQNILIGANARWGDSLPVSGLAEAANEVYRTGTLTGGLTDAINWASEAGETFGVKLKENIKFTKLSEKQLKGLTEAQREEYESKKAQFEAIEEYNKKVSEATSAEEFFQIALDECNDEQERQKLITDTLNGLYAESADAFKKSNKSVIEAREATAEYNEQMAILGAEMEPISTRITEMKTSFTKHLIPVIRRDVVPAIDDFVDSLEESDVMDKVAKGIGKVSKNALPMLADALEFVVDNIEDLVKVLGVAVTAWKVYQAAMSFTAGPAMAVAKIIGTLAAGIGALVLVDELAAESTDLLSESQREAVTAGQEAAEAYQETKEAADELIRSEMANVDYLRDNLLPELENLIDANGEVKKGEEERANFILGELNEALGTEYTKLSDIVDANGKIKDSIYEVIDAKKAQIMLDAHQDTYTQALESIAELNKTRATIAQEMVLAEQNVLDAQAKMDEAQKVFDEAVKTGSQTDIAIATRAMGDASTNLLEAKNYLDETKNAFTDSVSAVNEAYKDIENYELASELFSAGDVQGAIEALEDMASGFESASSTAQLSAEEQKKVLEQQVIDTEINAKLMKKAYEDGVAGVDEQMVKTAEKQAAKAKEEFHKVGGDVVKGIIKGIEGDSWILNQTMQKLIDDAVEAAEKAGKIQSPSKRFRDEVGKYIGQGVAVGVEQSTPDVVSAIERQIDSAAGAYSVGKVNISDASSSGGSKSGSSGLASGSGGVVVNQVNHYSQSHSRYEIWQSQENTAAAVKLALMGGA